MKSFDWRNMKSEWTAWWSGLSPARRLTPALLAAAYWLALGAVHGLRSDLILSSLLPVLLYYAGPRFRPVYDFLLPLFLISIIYDSQRYYSDYLRGPIHVRQPYEFDKRFFGIPTQAGLLTPNEWWQRHTWAPLDLVTGLAYIIFIPVFLLTAAYFRFLASRKGTGHCSGESIRWRSPQMMWAFFWVNVFGYSTYYWYAAAPPWYVALYGLGPADLSVTANVAGCARFDALVGLPVFVNWYGHSADVFGAIPSLHIAYPLIAVYYAFRFGALRVATLAFYVLMCFSAVYLNHHYVLDILWGSAYALGTAFGLDLLWNYRLKRAGVVVRGPIGWEPSPAR